jgi:hypothetical protein
MAKVNKGVYINYDEYNLPLWNERNKGKEFKQYKIQCLYDMKILKYPNRSHARPDPLEEKVKMVLAECKNDYEVDRVLHDVIVGNCTLEEMLTLKGMMM